MWAEQDIKDGADAQHEQNEEEPRLEEKHEMPNARLRRGLHAAYGDALRASKGKHPILDCPSKQARMKPRFGNLAYALTIIQTNDIGVMGLSRCFQTYNVHQS